MIVEPDRTLHLAVDRAQQFLAENVSQNAADQHSYEEQKHDYEVLKKEKKKKSSSVSLSQFIKFDHINK